MSYTVQELESDVKNFIDKHKSKSKETDARLAAIEQHVTAQRPGGFGFGIDDKSIGQQIIESEGFVALQKGARSSGTINVKSFRPPEQKTVISGTWSAAPQLLPVVATPGQR